MSALSGKRVLLIVTGGIAAYKALTLIREIQKRGGDVQAILTAAATQFVTPLSVSTLCGHQALTALFDPTREAEIGHIELSRSADLIVVAPASADFLAKMAQGHADDLATTTVLATDTRVLVAPAMNVRMWRAAATQRNVAQLRADGVLFAGPDDGEMACGEFGPGRMAEPVAIAAAIEAHFADGGDGPLSGRKIVVTSGPTREWIDPVRYLSNASSGKQGSAIGAALAELGAEVVFVTGPADTPAPKGCEIVEVETAQQMHDAVFSALPADAAVFCAAVADWRANEVAVDKIKKGRGGPPKLVLAENRDILADVSALASSLRPRLVIGFAAETSDLADRADRKRVEKGCDWILANDVTPGSGIFGGDVNRILFCDVTGSQDWGSLPKVEVGRKLAEKIAMALGGPKKGDVT